MVRSGGVALTAMAHLLVEHRTCPGEISDVYALLKDNEPIGFGYAASDVAWAYLDINGLEKYEGTRWQVKELLKDELIASGVGSNDAR